MRDYCGGAEFPHGLCPVARADGISVSEKNLSLTEVYTADEVFTTGTLGGLTPVVEIDGRRIGGGERGEITRRLQELYAEWVRLRAEPFG